MMPRSPMHAAGRSPSPCWVPGIVQVAEPEGVINLGPGHLDPDLLPIRLISQAYADALEEYGPAALTYGENQGPAPLRAALARREPDRQSPPGPEHLLVTAGTSQMLALLARTCAQPGDIVLAEAASYDLALGIFRQHGLRVRPVPADSAGPDPAAFCRAADAERAAGRRIAFAYLMPDCCNPTGVVTSGQRRACLLAAAADRKLLIVEDDAYADLDYDGGDRPESLAELGGYRGVIRLRTFSKILAPGLRLGWLITAPETVTRLAASPQFDSGGGLNHLAAVAMTPLLRNGALDQHVSRLRAELRSRRDALTGSLRTWMPSVFQFTVPRGGYFVWLTLPDAGPLARGPLTSGLMTSLVEAADRAGVPVAPGSRFGPAGRRAIRLSFSFHSPASLSEAAERLAAAWQCVIPAPHRAAPGGGNDSQAAGRSGHLPGEGGQ